MKRCKHQWNAVEFVGDPSHYSCTIRLACACGKIKERSATYEERHEETKRRVCSTCGFSKSEHVGGEDDPRECIRLMSDRIKDLESRLESLESWRNS